MHVVLVHVNLHVLLIQNSALFSAYIPAAALSQFIRLSLLTCCWFDYAIIYSFRVTGLLVLQSHVLFITILS